MFCFIASGVGSGGGVCGSVGDELLLLLGGWHLLLVGCEGLFAVGLLVMGLVWVI